MLESIREAISDYDETIELIISDNGSTDSTQQYIKSIMGEFKNLSYYHHNPALGVAERNFHFLMCKACSKYIWILGDDDKLEKDAIHQVMKYINNNVEFDLCICNYSLHSPDMESVYKNNFFDFKKPIIIRDKNELLREFSITLGFISAVIFNSNLVEKLDHEKYKCLEYTGFAFLFMIYSSLEKFPLIYFISKPLIKYRSSNARFKNTDWIKIFVRGSNTVLKELKNNGYYKKNINQAKNFVVS
jgi:glycosyltransferase involved in cell wall biosynthesis